MFPIIETLINPLMMIIVTIDVKEIMADDSATPINPKYRLRIGVSIQVMTVQNIINFKVTLISPMAFSALVKVVESVAQKVETENK